MANERTEVRVAVAFAYALAEMISLEEMVTVNARNAAETRGGICHSHDFCDANMAMLRAMERCGVEFDKVESADTPLSEEIMSLWNAAWSRAKAVGFNGVILGGPSNGNFIHKFFGERDWVGGQGARFSIDARSEGEAMSLLRRFVMHEPNGSWALLRLPDSRCEFRADCDAQTGEVVCTVNFSAADRFVRCDHAAVGLLSSLDLFVLGDYDHRRGGVTVRATSEALQKLAEHPADFIVVDPRSPQHGANASPLDSRYGAVRIAIQRGGLVPVCEFDAVEIESMVLNDDGDDYEVASSGDTACAFSVRMHYCRGGVDTVGDFPFDPDTPGDAARAAARADELALSLGDMVRMAYPSLDVTYILGRALAKDQRAIMPTPSSLETASPA